MFTNCHGLCMWFKEPHLWKSTMVEARFIGQVHMTRNKPEILTAQENRLPRCVTFQRIVLCASVVLFQEFHMLYLGPFSRETIGLDCPILSWDSQAMWIKANNDFKWGVNVLSLRGHSSLMEMVLQQKYLQHKILTDLIKPKLEHA